MTMRTLFLVLERPHRKIKLIYRFSCFLYILAFRFELIAFISSIRYDLIQLSCIDVYLNVCYSLKNVKHIQLFT